MKSRAFRPSVIDRLDSPEPLNEADQGIGIPLWLLLGLQGLLCAGVLIWVFYGKVPVVAKGVVIREAAPLEWVLPAYRPGNGK